MGMTEEERVGLDKSLKELNLSDNEVDKFTKAFKDPEFLKLFEEYAKEVSDPKVKAETDMYLRQLEMEGRVEEVYGKGAQLILPVPAFVVKTHNTVDGTKAFINICTSDKLDKASLKPAVGAGGQKGMHFDMPLCLGPRKAGIDKAGKPCGVWDFAVHPDSIKMAQAKPAIHTAMIENAIDKIEDCNEGVKLHRQTKLPKMTYKATEGCPTPHALAVRGSESAASVNGRVKPVIPGDAVPGAKANAANARGADSKSIAAELQQEPAGAVARSKFSFPSGRGAKAAATPAAALEPTQAGYQYPGGEVTPQWEVIHRGQVDLAEAWGDAGRGMALNTTHPKELVIRFTLPGVTSAAGVELDVSCNDVSILVPQKYKLTAPLPFTVDSEKGKAKFDKSKQQLEVVVPVVPPPLPIRQKDEDSAKRGDDVEDVTEIAAGSSAEAVMDGQGTGVKLTAVDNIPAPAAAEPAAQQEQVPASTASSTENQRRWAELHPSHASASPSGEAAGHAAAVNLISDGSALPDPALTEACCTAGEAPCQLADQLPGTEPVTVSAPPARKAEVIKLQPRLNRNLACDLD